MVASHIIAERGNSLNTTDTRLKILFLVPPLVGSQVLSNGEIWTDFRVGPDGFAQLKEISRLDAQVRAMSFRTGFRFRAAQAYYQIVEARIGELREREGVPTIGEFMERRLAPAMNSCKLVAVRQDTLAEKISRSDDMLRTRVNLAQERQSQGVLRSLSNSADLQSRLQQAVEGLSVVAIS